MQFDPENKIVKLCAEGMSREGEGKAAEACKLFYQAWDEATNDFEKFIAAHYIARHQKSIENKLNWDKKALQLALKINEDGVKATFPSLYLNIAKCYEDLNDIENAKQNYQTALSFTGELPANGYGDMIKAGIESGLKRVMSAI